MAPILNSPIILDVGKARRRDIKDIKQGRGRLLADVHDAVAEVSASVADQVDNKQLVPVVLVYQRKRRRRKGGRRNPANLLTNPFSVLF